MSRIDFTDDLDTDEAWDDLDEDDEDDLFDDDLDEVSAPRTVGPYAHALSEVPPCPPGMGNGYAPSFVDDRWRLAGRLARSRCPIAHDDHWVELAARFLQRLVACRDDAERQQLAQDMPDIDGAYRLHQSTDKLARGLVEARLLARQSFEQVGQACHLRPQVVEAYHNVFFDLTGKLQAKGYIMSEVIGASFMVPIDEKDVDILLKQYGHGAGPFAVDDLERYLRHGLTIPRKLDSLTRAQLEDLYGLLLARAFVLSSTLPPMKIGRVALLLDLINALERLIGAYPEASPEGRPSGILASLADQQEWWQIWRTATVAASSGRAPRATKAS
jgi:hypothetical protein